MSDNQLFIKIAFESNSMSAENLKKIYAYPVGWGEMPYSIKDSPEKVHDLINKSVSNDLAQDGDSIGIDYLWFNTVFRRREKDFFFISFHQGNLDADKLIRSGDARLDEVYSRADRFINFVKYVWKLEGKGLWGFGDCDLIYDTLYDFKLSESEKAPHFWLTILSEKLFVPEKYSYGTTHEGKPYNEFPWYRKEKIKNGTLLLSSPLPYWAINEVPKQTPLEKLHGEWGKTQWNELEKKWRSLEAKK